MGTEPSNRVAEDFMHRLWGRKPDTTAVQLWDKASKKTHYFDVIPAAATFAAEAAKASDIYLAAGLAARANKPQNRRASATQVAGIPGLWADIDINGGPQGQTDKAPDLEAAMELARCLIEPTLLVASGYGLQAWWLFEEPWIFTNEAEREQANRLALGFQSALKAQAKDAGFSIDSTADLARLMRLPGTLNHKATKPAVVSLVDHEGSTHDVEALHRIAHAFMETQGDTLSLVTGASVQISVNGASPKPPWERLQELCDVDPDFDARWNHRASNKTKSWSGSEYDLSIASTLVNAGFDDQEIAECLRQHRKRFYPNTDKGDRVDYLKRTIGKARGGEKHEAAQREQEFERLDAIVELVQTEGDDTATVARKLSLATKIIGGPEIKELVQEGQDPDNSRFIIVLADGREVPLGSVAGLTSQERFRNSFCVVTGHLPRRVKASSPGDPSWDDVVRSLFKAVVVNHAAEHSRGSRALSWVERFCDRRVSKDQHAACEALDPFEKEGMVYVPLAPLRTWLNKVQGERIEPIDLILFLKAAGFEQVVVAYNRSEGGRSSRSYYRAPAELLSETVYEEGDDDE